MGFASSSRVRISIEASGCLFTVVELARMFLEALPALSADDWKAKTRLQISQIAIFQLISPLLNLVQPLLLSSRWTSKSWSHLSRVRCLNETSVFRPKPPSQTPKLEILPQSQLSMERKSRRPATRRRRQVCQLLVDKVRKLSKPQMLENFRKGRETLRTRAELLAPGASLMHPRRVRSFYTDRLLALPANFELSICRTLVEVWRSKRRQCELGRLDEDFVSPRPPSSIQHSRSNLPSIRESEMESSREMARGGGLSEISLAPLAPQVSSVYLQDQSTGEKRSLALPTATQSVLIVEEEAQQKPEEAVNLGATASNLRRFAFSISCPSSMSSPAGE